MIIPGRDPNHIYRGISRSDSPVDQRPPRLSIQLREISIEYSHSDLSAATQNWHASKKLGSGSYGSVYKGELEDGSEVAIKALDLGALGAQGQSPEMAGFDEEVQMLSKFRHPNLVTLLGWGRHNLFRYLVYELLAGGDAFQRLQKSKQLGSTLPFHWYERISVLLDSATGLSHMHNSKPKAFHRDIKSANILLDRHGTAKMADFGLSCTSGRSGALHVTVRTISGTPGYACPIYSKTGRVTEGSEVYSFGMVMLELLTGLPPAAADPKRPGGIIYHIADAVLPNRPGAIDRVIQHLDKSASWPREMALELGALGLRCINAHDDEQRPKFVELVRGLRALGERFPKPSASPPAMIPQAAQAPQQVVAGAPAPVAAVQPAAVRVASPQRGRPDVTCQAQAAAPQPASVQHRPSAAGAPVPVRVESAQEAQFADLPCPLRPPSLAAATSTSQHSGATTLAKERISGAAGVPVSSITPSRTSFSNADKVSADAPWPFVLELITAVGLDINSLSLEQRRMRLLPTPEAGGSSVVVPVGRQHQSSFFETWLPDENLRSCISRTAFDISCSSAGENIQLVARGANPVCVDGKVVARNVGVPLRPGSEVGFTYMTPTGEVSTFLLLRFSSTRHSQTTTSAVGGSVPVSRGEGAAAATASAGSSAPVHSPANIIRSSARSAGSTHNSPAALIPSEANLPGAKLPQTAFEPPVRISLGKANPDTALPDMTEGTSRWRLACLHVEGLSDTALAALPSELRNFPVAPDGTTYVGRQHQPHVFEALLVGNTTLLSLISRTHVQLEAPRGSSSLSVANTSSNPLYVDREAVGKGEVRMIAQDAVLSFARLENGIHVHFLELQVQLCGTAHGDNDKKSPGRPPIATSEKEPARLEVSASKAMAQSASCASSTPLKSLPQRSSQEPSPITPPLLGSPAGQYPPSGGSVSTPLKPQSGTGELLRLQPMRETLKEKRPPQTLEGERQSVNASSSPPAAPSPETAASASPVTGVKDSPTGTCNTVDIVLELFGEGVCNVEPEQRRIGPISLDEPLLVGRRHQPELLRRAVSRDCLQFLSRDHFRIAYEGDTYKLLALTSNPIWRDRDGDGPLELTRGDVVTLQPGDRIALGTGGDASTPQEACRTLCWHFRRAERARGAEGSPGSSPSAPLQRRLSSGFGTPPSPGGIGPRVSDAAPWPVNPQADSGSGHTFEPMLPPADDLCAGPRTLEAMRPSEACGPAPRLLPPRTAGMDRQSAKPAVSSRKGAAPALRVPGVLPGIYEET